MSSQNCIDTIYASRAFDPLSPTWRAWFRAGAGLAAREVAGWLGVLRLWSNRSRQRRRLLDLDDRILKDIGVDWIDARREAAKPFWRQ